MKILPIIKVGDYLYAVDNKYPIGGVCICITEKEHPQFVTIETFDGQWVNTNWNTGWYFPDVPFGILHIVAANNPSLKGVLQLPPIEEDILSIVNEWQNTEENKGKRIWNAKHLLEHLKKYLKEGADEDYILRRISLSMGAEKSFGFQDGYKAAQAKGKYSEEDIDKAWNCFLDREGYHPARMDLLEELSKSLSKVPKAIEVETIETFIPDEKGKYHRGNWLPKHDNNIIIGRYIYE